MRKTRQTCSSASSLSQWILLLVGALIIAPVCLRAEMRLPSKQSVRMPLVRFNPSGWFTILVPVNSPSFQSKADIDGRYLDGPLIRIDYSYYGYVNTPNFLIDSATGRPFLETRLPERGAKRTWIGGRRASIRFFDTDRSPHSYRFGYRVTFLDIRVPIGDGRTLLGKLEFELSTDDRRYLRDVRRIIRSVVFSPNAQPT